jgi:hypothetical protein
MYDLNVNLSKSKSKSKPKTNFFLWTLNKINKFLKLIIN